MQGNRDDDLDGRKHREMLDKQMGQWIAQDHLALVFEEGKGFLEWGPIGVQTPGSGEGRWVLAAGPARVRRTVYQGYWRGKRSPTLWAKGTRQGRKFLPTGLANKGNPFMP